MMVLIGRRLLFSLPIVLGVTLIAFLILALTPGDPVETMLGARASAEQKAALRAELGLDRSLTVQYFSWMGNVLTGDLGTSIMTRTPVTDVIWTRLPYTLSLTFSALLLSVVVGIPLGIFAAAHQNSVADHLSMGSAMVFYSTPDFWLGLILTLIFAITLKWLPVSGARSWDAIILPTLALGLPQVGAVARLMRAEVLQTMRSEFALTARAKGVSARGVMWGHVLRNASVPVVTYIFLALPWLIGGAVVIEEIFAWPGMGQLMLQAILRKDFPVIQALLLIIALLTVISSVLGDLAAAAIDPRIREG